MFRSKSFVAAFLVLLLVALSVVPGYAAAPPSAPEAPSLREYAPGEVIVRYADATPETARRSLRAQYRLATKRPLPLPGCELVAIGPGSSVASVVAALKADRRVKYAEPNYLYRPTTSDPDYAKLWGLENTGQPVNGVTGTADVDVDAPEAWATTTGDPAVVVGIIDTGVQIDHPDLAANVWTNEAEHDGIAGVDDDGNGYVDDIHGWNFYDDTNDVFTSASEDYHGTHVAGTIAAVGGNGLGVVGVAPTVKVMPLKFLGPDGGYTSDAVDALNYARRMGADLTSNSWGGGLYSQALYDAIVAFGGPFVVAAGNDGRNLERLKSYPASYTCPNLISVAAVSNTGALASWSNYGVVSVDVGAPGVSVWSTYPTGTYAYLSGTSMATPHVSGIVALVLSLRPELTGIQVRDIVLASARANPLASLAGKTVTGGMANAAEAVRLTIPPEPDTTPPDLVRTDPENGATGVDADQSLQFVFSEPVQAGPAYAGITLTDAGGTPVLFAKSIAGNTLTLDPAVRLDYEATYTATVPAGAVTDLAGLPTTTATVVAFTASADNDGPVAISVFPADKATGISRTVEVVFTFDEPITVVDAARITFKQSKTAVPFRWHTDGNALHIQADATLLARKAYVVTVGAGAVADGFGNLSAQAFSTGFTTAK